jgi:hypothetical protein
MRVKKAKIVSSMLFTILFLLIGDVHCKNNGCPLIFAMRFLLQESQKDHNFCSMLFTLLFK